MSDVFQEQVGGTHYTDMKVQPFEFAMRHKLDAGAFAILKYISRYDKPTGKGLEDLKKAEHFVRLRIGCPLVPRSGFDPEIIDYLRKNKMNMFQWYSLQMLFQWLQYPNSEYYDLLRESILQQIKEMEA